MNDTLHPRPVDQVVEQAYKAFRLWSRTPRSTRARTLVAVANALDAHSEQLIATAREETHLPEPRLAGELKRTSFQLRLFSETLLEGSYLDVRVDHADSDWPMGAPRPDLRRTSQALGPVVVYAASNFPFAFSVAGGDTASALAAGASVILKAHAGHPELSRETATVVINALNEAGAPEGLFTLVESREEGLQVLRDPRVKAGSFTGSIPGGRALYDVAVSRPEPIPFYGELGSVNPTFVTVSASQGRAEEIADGFRSSFTMGSGQFCTKPGVIVLPEGSAIIDLLRSSPLPAGQPMLNARIRSGYSEVLNDLSSHESVEVLVQGADPYGENPSPTLLLTSSVNLLADRENIFRECFGPTALIVTYRDEQELVRIAEAIDGQLTATIIAEENEPIVPALVDELREKAGRILWNQWPTGVSVTHAQQHGGPYPATTASSTTSVGTAAIYRFLRPVSFQGFPQALLLDELTESPAAPLVRRIDGDLELPTD